MRRATVLAAPAAVLAVAAIALAGCGASSRPAPSPTRPAARALFSHACGACHSLTGHNLPKDQGGDLLAARLPRSALLQYAREMPVPHPLTAAQLRTIVAYVHAVQQGR